MRCVWIALLVAACGDGHANGDGGTQASCADLSGTWQFTGTETTMRYRTGDTMPQTTQTNNTFAVTLTKKDACTLQVAFDSLAASTATVSGSTTSGDLDGTNLTTSGYHGSFTMTTSQLNATVGWDREAQNGDQGSTDYVGTVSR